MSEQFPHLFQPLRVGALTLKNHFMNTGHAVHFQTGDGIPTEKYVHYLRERAKGGAGITYITPLTTWRTSTRRLPPPRLAGGISSLICAHSASVRSLG